MTWLEEVGVWAIAVAMKGFHVPLPSKIATCFMEGEGDGDVGSFQIRLLGFHSVDMALVANWLGIWVYLELDELGCKRPLRIVLLPYL